MELSKKSDRMERIQLFLFSMDCFTSLKYTELTSDL